MDSARLDQTSTHRRPSSVPEGRCRKLARKHTPIAETLKLKQYWCVELPGRLGVKILVPVPVVTHQSLNAV